MIKKLFFMLTALFFIPVPVFAAGCNDITVDPQIKLTSSYGKLTIDQNKTTEEITSLAASLNLVENGLFASGLSTVNINFDITLNALGVPADNVFCVIPTQIDLFLGLDEPTIHLAKELTADSCEYNMVLRHEQTHQQINKSALEYYLPMFKTAALQIARSIKPVEVKDIDDIKPAIGELTATYNQKMTPVVNFIKKEMLVEQSKLDNPQNYLYESKLCP